MGPYSLIIMGIKLENKVLAFFIYKLASKVNLIVFFSLLYSYGSNIAKGVDKFQSFVFPYILPSNQRALESLRWGAYCDTNAERSLRDREWTNGSQAT
jgi:hypothetical protein